MMVAVRTRIEQANGGRVLISLWEKDVALCIRLLDAARHPTDTSPEIRSFQQVQRHKERFRGPRARPQDRR